MRRKILFVSTIVLLVLVEIASVFLMYKSSTGEKSKLEDVRLRETTKKNNTFAIMLEQSDGTYSASESNAWPTDMKFNSEKSGCIDANGNKLEDVLSYDISTNIINLRVNGSSYCYLYFDFMPLLSELCTGEESLGNCLIENNNYIVSLSNIIYGDMYRYQGTNEKVNDNYVCFGTSDSNECVENKSKYMYRIIGINNSGEIKLIKKEALDSAFNWNEDNAFSVSTTGTTKTLSFDWMNSSISGILNGNMYLTNENYILKNWRSKIANTTWKYGVVASGSSKATSYQGNIVFDLENGWEDNITSKVGLMYIHDYYYAYELGNPKSASNALTSWIHLSNCDLEAPSNAEWTMAHYNKNSGYAWYVNSSGAVSSAKLTLKYSVRPVFYLSADEVYMSGDGTIDNPIMLSEPVEKLCEETISECLMESLPNGFGTTLKDGLYRYQGTNDTVDNYICFGYSDAESDCDFSNADNSDKYAYRIIGINSEGQLKLIKKEALDETLSWGYSTLWTKSTAYLSINDEKFYNNTEYISNLWKDKIAIYNWKYITLDDGLSGWVINSNPPGNLVASSIETDTASSVSNKIGLIYLHDWFDSYQSGIDCSLGENLDFCITSWMHLSNNDLSSPNTDEWTMSVMGVYDQQYGCYCGFGVNSNGGYALTEPCIYSLNSIRPVFYLTSDVQYVSGTGTSSDPFIIS